MTPRKRISWAAWLALPMIATAGIANPVRGAGSAARGRSNLTAPISPSPSTRSAIPAPRANSISSRATSRSISSTGKRAASPSGSKRNRSTSARTCSATTCARSPSSTARRFPSIDFVSKSVERVDDHTVRVSGDLTLLGVTKPLAVDVEVRREIRGRAHAARLSSRERELTGSNSA